MMTNDGDSAAGWIMEVEKLRCLVVLDDGEAGKLTPRPGPAYFRAFIVQDRETAKVVMKFRYHYKNPDEKSWYRVEQKKNEEPAEAIEQFKAGMKFVLDEAAQMLGDPLSDEAIQFFEPPDDNGNPMHTVMWLDEKDLIDIKIEEVAAEPTESTDHK